MTVAIIGAGVMGEALLSGLIRGGHDLADLGIRALKELEQGFGHLGLFGFAQQPDRFELAGVLVLVHDFLQGFDDFGVDHFEQGLDGFFAYGLAVMAQ